MRKLLLVATATWAMVPAVAMAQGVDKNAPAVASDDGTQRNAGQNQIVVTAERRNVSVQDLPVSVMAFNGDMLRERGVANIDDLQADVPSLSYVDNGNTKFINIRGVGISESAPNAQVGVAVHLDGGYISQVFTVGDAFFDVATVEVLRGPQGTYSGQNASGGSIFITSAKPVYGQVEGWAEATLGDYGHRKIGGAVSVPLGQDWAARVSIEGEKRDSYFTNLGPTGNVGAVGSLANPGNLQRFLGRFQIMGRPADNLEVRLIHQVSVSKSDGTVYKRNDAPELAKPFTLAYDVTNPKVDDTYDRTTLNVEWEATSAFSVKAMGVYETLQHNVVRDDDATTPALRPDVPQHWTLIDAHSKYYEGELDLISNSTHGEGFEWTAGAVYLDLTTPVAFLTTPYTGLPTLVRQPGGVAFDWETYRRNWAVFGEVGYWLTPKLEVKLGGRYNKEFNGWNYLILTNGFQGAQGPDLGPLRYSDDAKTGRVLINWEPNPDQLVYFTVSRGYKPGGVTPFGQRFEKETVTNYEAGWKGTMLNGALQTSLSAFYMAYNGFQASFSTIPGDPSSQKTYNVKGTKIKGVEGQISLNLGGFSADLATSILDAKYGNQDVVQPANTIAPGNPATATVVNLNGLQINYAPKFTISGGIAYKAQLGSGTLRPSVRVSHTASQWVSFYHLPYGLMPQHTLVNAQLKYESDAKWSVTLEANNLLDDTYIQNVGGGTTPPGSVMFGSPRQVDVRFGVRF